MEKIKDLIKLKAGETLNIEIKICCDKDKFYTEKTLNEFMQDMAKYYFNGDPTLIYKYFKEDYILDHNID